MYSLTRSDRIGLMANRVVLREGFIEIVCEGEQTEETVREMSRYTRKIARETWGELKPLVLVNLNNMGASRFASRTAAKKQLEKLNFHAIAVCADSIFLRHVASLLIRASTLGPRIKIFAEREKAIDWLLRQRPAAEIGAKDGGA
jgi:hypothetical protein